MENPFIKEFINKNQTAIAFHKKQYVEERKFVKLYIEANEVLCNLKTSGRLIFEYIFAEMQKAESFNRTELDISYKHYVLFCRRREIKPIAEKTFYRARSELVQNKVIAPSGVNGIFFINLNFFFNGDRFFVATEYIKKNSSPVKAESENASKEEAFTEKKKRSAFVL